MRVSTIRTYTFISIFILKKTKQKEEEENRWEGKKGIVYSAQQFCQMKFLCALPRSLYFHRRLRVRRCLLLCVESRGSLTPPLKADGQRSKEFEFYFK